MSENKTKQTEVSVEAFLETIDEKRRNEARQIIEIMQSITTLAPKMWGASIIGFGSVHYRYASGHEGDMPLLGFSPRRARLSFYFEGFDAYGEQLEQLGKHKTGVGCLYVNKLEDIDLSVLRKMLKRSYEQSTSTRQPVDSVEEYVESVPERARPHFDTLRAIVREEFPEGNEVASYGIVGYKRDIKKRGLLFISGWKDHVAIYPVPKSAILAEDLKPFVKGKGTLWFSLDRPLPIDIIRTVVRSLTQQ